MRPYVDPWMLTSPSRIGVDAVASSATTDQGGVARALVPARAVIVVFATLVAVVVATVTLIAGLETEELEAGADARA